MPQTESFEFQAETTRLLNLVINSLYTTKDIFLRELISNASDALDRLRFETLSRPDLVDEDHPWEIRVEPNSENRTLSIHDTGIGMSREEVIRNLGTIAQSGTRELLKEAAEGKNRQILSSLIGQFGVGFYSVFMVADRVSVITRKAGEEEATFWESTGEGRFDVSSASRKTCGTSVTLHLKPVDEEAGIHDYSDCTVLERIVKKYSDFITFPVLCPVEKAATDSDDADSTEKKVEIRTLNAMKPIWTRSEVSDEEYAEFYRHISRDWEKPLERISVRAEGRLEYRALLFIPSVPPLDFGPAQPHWGLQLYAKSVMIMEECEDLLPPWLRFVRGVVDSADLPLNISREMLQQDRHIVQIRRFLTSKILKTLERMFRDDRETYLKFWRAFGRILKEGIATGQESADRIRPLLLFASSADAEKPTSLDEYVSRMKKGQDAIYYISGESRSLLEKSPHLEAYLSEGYEVLFLDEPVDELIVQFINEHEGHRLKSIARGSADLGGKKDSGEEEKETEESFVKDFFDSLRKNLGTWVQDIRFSERLKTSPACLVIGEHDISPQLEKILRFNRQEVPHSRRILEINRENPIVRKMLEKFKTDPEDPEIAENAELLHGYALLAEGSPLPEDGRFTQLLLKRMERDLD